jgi:hypothetical protein
MYIDVARRRTKKEWIREWFPVSYDHVFISFLPNKDRQGREFDVEPWETRALEIQGRLFRGATSYPARGSYRQMDQQGAVVTGVMIEETRMVVSFVTDDDLTEETLKEATGFLKEFGRATDQESVAFVLDGEMYYLEVPSKAKQRR